MAADPYDDWKAAGRPGDYQSWLKQSGRTAPAGSKAAGALAGVTGSKGQPDPSTGVRAPTGSKAAGGGVGGGNSSGGAPAGCVGPNATFGVAGSVSNPSAGCKGGTSWSALWKMCCPPGAAAGGISMPTMGGGFPGGFPGGGAGGGTYQPSTLQRPNLTPIDPQAAYDPEIARQLARQRSYTGDLQAGTGFAMDVLTGQQRDVGESQMREAEQAAAQAGIPFDRGAFLASQQRGLHGAMATEKLQREQMVGDAIGAESGVAQGQAGERTDRLGIDLRRDMGENELALDRYGIDAAAATAANNALMDFYGRMTSGMFGMMGSALSMGGNSSSNSYTYGSY
jgi:hypothetical protein